MPDKRDMHKAKSKRNHQKAAPAANHGGTPGATAHPTANPTMQGSAPAAAAPAAARATGVAALASPAAQNQTPPAGHDGELAMKAGNAPDRTAPRGKRNKSTR